MIIKDSGIITGDLSPKTKTIFVERRYKEAFKTISEWYDSRVAGTAFECSVATGINMDIISKYLFSR